MYMGPGKLKTIHEFLESRNKKELQSFVGFCNFYQKFGNHHATVIGLIQKNIPRNFDREEVKFFDPVKMSFTNRYLSHPLFKQNFTSRQTRVSQDWEQNYFRRTIMTKGVYTISFASRKLNSVKMNYSITELELAKKVTYLYSDIL